MENCFLNWLPCSETYYTIMANRTPAQIKSKAAMANKVFQHHFGKKSHKIEFMPEGKTNFVFEITAGRKHYIIRISTAQAKLHDFIKEQWAVQKASEAGVPVPEILEVGTEVIPFPYMLQEKINGTEAINHPERINVLSDLGNYAKLIHSIPTNGYGHNFDWSQNKLSKQSTWSDYLENELRVTERLQFLQSNHMLPRRKVLKLATDFRKISRWKFDPVLNHCDLRLKNVIVNKKGKIEAIIDWENCASNIAPYWDLSIALHDLSIDGKQRFLEGYGVDFAEFNKMSYALTAFNIINYVPSLERAIEKKDKTKLEFYKLRLNGAFDLFSL